MSTHYSTVSYLIPYESSKKYCLAVLLSKKSATFQQWKIRNSISRQSQPAVHSERTGSFTLLYHLYNYMYTFEKLRRNSLEKCKSYSFAFANIFKIFLKCFIRVGRCKINVFRNDFCSSKSAEKHGNYEGFTKFLLSL